MTSSEERGEKCKPPPILDSESEPRSKRKEGLRVGNVRHERGIARRGAIGPGSLRNAIGAAEGPGGRETGSKIEFTSLEKPGFDQHGSVSSEFAKFSLKNTTLLLMN
jgi:hypothetical protein